MRGVTSLLGSKMDWKLILPFLSLPHFRSFGAVSKETILDTRRFLFGNFFDLTVHFPWEKKQSLLLAYLASDSFLRLSQWDEQLELSSDSEDG